MQTHCFPIPFFRDYPSAGGRGRGRESRVEQEGTAGRHWHMGEHKQRSALCREEGERKRELSWVTPEGQSHSGLQQLLLSPLG